MGTADNFLLSLFVWEQTNTHTTCSSKTNTVHQAFSAAGNSHRWYSGSSFIRLWPLIPADDLHVERLQVLKSALWFPLAAGFCRVSQTHLKKKVGTISSRLIRAHEYQQDVLFQGWLNVNCRTHVSHLGPQCCKLLSSFFFSFTYV